MGTPGPCCTSTGRRSLFSNTRKRSPVISSSVHPNGTGSIAVFHCAKDIMRQRITRDDHASKDGGTREDQAARQAVDDLFSLTYEELRRLASSVKRSSANVTLDSTALVNEAWLKLAQSPSFA